MARFDECYMNMPSMERRPEDYDDFWKARLDELKRIPLETETDKKISRRLLSEINYNVTYQSADKYRLQATFIGPKKLVKKTPVVVIFPDYMSKVEPEKKLTSAGFAQIILRLRGHEQELIEEDEAPEAATADSGQAAVKPKTEAVARTYGYFSESLTDPDTFYMTRLLLDAYRTVEMARLRKEVDSSRIYLWGQGTGAAMALFVSQMMKRATALVLDKPAFVSIDEALTISKSGWVREINSFLKKNQRRRKAAHKTLAYNDGLFSAAESSVPMTMIVNLEEKKSIPEAAFPAFHAYPGEKEMFLFTHNDPDKKKEERRQAVEKVIDFFSTNL